MQEEDRGTSLILLKIRGAIHVHLKRDASVSGINQSASDLYGVHAAIDFTARLRGTERFDSVQALVTQMHEDVAQARALTGADHSDA